MTKHKGNALAISEAARQAATALTAWEAVEARAKQLRADAEAEPASTNFAEFHLTGSRIQGVIKAGEVILKIDA